MSFLQYFTYFICIISSCNGCFPTPNPEPVMQLCPLVACPALAGIRVTISTPTASDTTTCVYTATATCTSPIALGIQFNGATPNLASPQIITCDETTMQWTYNNAGIQTPITTAECICPNQACAGYIVSGINFNPTNPVFSGAIPDDNCIYFYVGESCVIATETMIQFNSGADVFPPPRSMQCTGGEPNAYYRNAANVLTLLMDMRCVP